MAIRHDDIAAHAEPTHGHSLADDRIHMERLLGRRRALQWFAGAGTAALLTGCGGSGSTTADDVAVVTGTVTATPTPSTTVTTPTTSGAVCIADSTETNGPYPADGTNTSSGTTSNALTVSGIVRSDIRSSFLGASTTIATGVEFKLTLTVVDVNATCAPLAGYAVYIWCCDRSGNYSLYTAAPESYLRGVQVTDANGQITFTLIVPGCYSGRWPHIHLEVFSSLSTATSGRYASLVGQLALPAAVCATVYADTTAYPSSARNFAQISVSTDNVFNDNSAAQIAQQTPTMVGSVAEGYTGNATIGLAR
jgi:protocatechuate 3,4-dioxygenase beta subunit